MDILDSIVSIKREEISARKKICPLNNLKNSFFFERTVHSFADSLRNRVPSIIGEFKRKSPSRGIINSTAGALQVAYGYQKAGVAAMSVLTDNQFFGGDKDDLERVAMHSDLPLLRKDFIIDEYQVYESKSIGASAILLIGSVLTKSESEDLATLAYSIGLDVLFEIHDEKDLEKLNPEIRIVGVNNRSLKTFEINMEKSSDLLGMLPDDCLKVAESGFQTAVDVMEMYTAGYDAFLIGERFMKADDPGKCAEEFITGLKIVS